MKEYTGTLNLTIEVTIKAKNRKQALTLFDDLYLNVSVENEGDQEIEILSDNLYALENNWELED